MLHSGLIFELTEYTKICLASILIWSQNYHTLSDAKVGRGDNKLNYPCGLNSYKIPLA